MATIYSHQEFERRAQDVAAARASDRQRREEARGRDHEHGRLENINRLLRETISRAHVAVRLQLEGMEVDAKLKLQQAVNQEFLNLSAVRALEYAGWAATTPAAYVVDCILFAPNARHLAQRAFPGQGVMIAVMSFVIPGVVIALENAIANHLTDWRESHDKRILHTLGVWSAAVLATLVMPALIAVTQWAAQPADPSARLAVM